MATALVFGGSGLLGREVQAVARARGHRVEAPARASVDLTDEGAVRDCVRSVRPDLVFNCAALTDVDGCESRVEEAFEINGRAVGRLSRWIDEASQAVLIHVSTDYVFDGSGARPYREDSPTAPRSVYGRSKLLAEQLVAGRRAVSVRTSWLFGVRGRSFVSAILERAERGEELRVVADQTGCPTFAPYLARALVELGERWREDRNQVPEIVHYCNREATTWFGLAERVVELFFEPSRRVRVTPIGTEELPRPAPRPLYSVLAVDAFEGLVGRPVESWVDGLEALRRARLQTNEKGAASDPALEGRGRDPRFGSLHGKPREL